MKLLGIEAIYPKPKTTRGNHEHRVYPYLLRGLRVDRPNQVWASDITYIPMRQGFLYLVAVLDWYSRYVISWRLSNTLDGAFCREALEEALLGNTPEIFNTDQGAQFTATAFTCRLEQAGIQVSMDGKGRALDNVFVERLWWSVKYEEVYLKSYDSVSEVEQGLSNYFQFLYARATPQFFRKPHAGRGIFRVACLDHPRGNRKHLRSGSTNGLPHSSRRRINLASVKADATARRTGQAEGVSGMDSRA